MADKVKQSAAVRSISRLAEDIVNMWIISSEIADGARAGQFISLYCREGSRLLPRPISICQIDRKNHAIRLVFRIVGEGTREFASLKEGDHVEVMGPLGNGFTLEGTKAILIGGGIGIPPMLQLARELSCEKQIVLGYRDSHLFLKEEFESFGTVYTATEDGSYGTKGHVIQAVEEHALKADIIYACGPLPMLKGVKEYAQKMKIPAQISMEEKMACGIGACLACVCKSKETDPHTNMNNKRVCKDGPVFYAKEVEL